MAEKLVINNFRGVKEGSIDGLKPLSVIVGRNNSGKSTLLEALYLGSMGFSEDVALAKRRGWHGVDFLNQLAFEKTSGEPTVWLDEWPVSRSTLRSGLCTFVDPGLVTEEGSLEDAYSSAVDRGREEALDAFAKAIDETGPALRILKRGNRSVLHSVTKERAVPVSFSGDGFERLLFVAFNLATHTGELVLLEEPECFQHPSYLGRLAALIWAAVGQNTQVVISTHSLELLKHLFLAEAVPLDKAAVFHTSLTRGRFKAVTIPGPSAAGRLDELGEDLRQ